LVSNNSAIFLLPFSQATIKDMDMFSDFVF
jgi:hypothetical protein